jgi:TetR/AcrR family transcriptional repressor of nem operon
MIVEVIVVARHKEFDRAKAVDQALRVFWCKGYEAASVQDLLDAMEISRGSMYDTFTDKRTLYLETLDRYTAMQNEQLASRFAEPLPAITALRKLFDTIIDESVRDPDYKGCFVVNTIIEVAPHDDEIRLRAQRQLARVEAILFKVIRAGQRSGEIIEDVDAEKTARLLNNTLQGLRVLGKAATARAVLQDVASAALSTLQ